MQTLTFNPGPINEFYKRASTFGLNNLTTVILIEETLLG